MLYPKLCYNLQCYKEVCVYDLSLQKSRHASGFTVTEIARGHTLGSLYNNIALIQSRICVSLANVVLLCCCLTSTVNS